MKTITQFDATVYRAEEVKPGMITLDGIVLDVGPVYGPDGKVSEIHIQHHASHYSEKPDEYIQIYGRITQPMVATLLQALVDSGELEVT